MTLYINIHSIIKEISIFKLLIIVASFLLGSCNLYAQQDYLIKGRILDEQHQSIEWGTVVIHNLKDSTFISGGYTDENGNFEITSNTKKCFLKSSFAGYEETTKILYLKEDITDLGNIILSQGVTLSEVEVTAKKRTLSYRNGTLSYIPNNILYDNSLELLKTVPLLMVDKDENLLIKGSYAKVLINGKDTKLSGQELKSYLKAIAPEEIEKIEVITNPSAKYEAQGSTGIINILLKEKPLGFLGSLSSSVIHNENIGVRQRGGFSYFDKKIGIATSLNYNDTKGFSRLAVSKFQASDDEILFLDNSDTDFNFKLLTGKISLNYYPYNNTTIGTFFKATKDITDIQTSGSSIFENEGIANNTILTTLSDSDDIYYTGGIDYQQTFDTLGTTLNIDYLYLNVNKKNDADQLVEFHEQGNFEDDFLLLTNNDQLYSIHSIKGDFTYPIRKKIVLETGLKFSNVKNRNSLLYNYDPNDEQFILIPIENNSYNYRENIYAFYLSGNTEYKGISFNIGTRVELTQFNAETINDNGNSKNKNHYFDFFPNLSASYTSAKNHSWSLSYSRRINRPNYQDLNPSILYGTQYIYRIGNPLLRPEYSNNLEAGFKIGSFVASVFSNWIDDPIGEYIEQDNTQNTLLVRKDNLEKSNKFGILLSNTIDLTKKASLQISINGQRNENLFQEIRQEIITAEINTNLSYQFTSNFNGYWSTYYTSPFLYGLYRAQGQFINNIGFSFKKNNLKVGVSVRDIFNAGRWDSIIQSDRYITQWVNRWPTGVYNITIGYQFGNKKIKSKATFNGNTSSEESSRI